MFYRYTPRFFGRLKHALAHHQVAPSDTPRLSSWTRTMQALVRRVYHAADQHGLDDTARRALVLHLDKRDISVETILATLRHHAAHEYPYLLREGGQHSLTALYATNLNDRYLVLRLGTLDAAQVEPMKTALADLRAHLDAIPSEQPGT